MYFSNQKDKKDVKETEMKKKEKSEFRIRSSRIKKNDPLWEYCDDICFSSKNLCNSTQFYIRQLMTGLKKPEDERTDNEKEVIQIFRDQIEPHDSDFMGPLNAQRLKKWADGKARKYVKQLKEEELPVNPDWTAVPAAKSDEKFFTFFEMPTAEKWYPGYNLLDGVFKEIKQPDYKDLPAHTAQETLKQVCNAWKGYFQSLRSYKKNPDSFTGKPKIPGYLDKTGRNTAVISNQSAKILEGNILQLPKYHTKKVVYKKLKKKFKVPDDWKLAEVRIVPCKNFYNLELVFNIGKKELPEAEPMRIMGVDLGLSVFAAISFNWEETPLIVRSGPCMDINSRWNNNVDDLLFSLYSGKNLKDWKGLTSKRIQTLTVNRNSRVKDFMHKASRAVVDAAVERKVDAIVVGQNKLWKQEVNLGSFTNRKFVQLPHSQFIEFLQYKAKAAGIPVIVTEESYTSVSSFFDGDPIPVWSKNNHQKYQFSGKREKRGLYVSKMGIKVHADIHASSNMIRKAFPDLPVTDEWKKGLKRVPQILEVLKDKKGTPKKRKPCKHRSRTKNNVPALQVHLPVRLGTA